MNTSNESINILCATDDNYAPYCGIMLTSLFESNMDSKFNVFVFVDGCLSDDNNKKYSRLARRYGADIHLMPIDNQLLGKCPVNHQNGVDNHVWVTLPTYYRLLASELLPEDVHKVIYLDCDIAVVGNIRAFWDMDVTNVAIVGVKDCDDENNGKRLGILPGFGYMNAGVALYNLDYWRVHHITESFFDFIRDNEPKLLLMDQDVVNGVLFDRKNMASERYNFQVSFFAKSFWGQYSSAFKETLLEENKKVAIIHYCGGIKPWDYRYYGSPYYAEWERFRKMSLWRKSHITKPVFAYVKFLAKKTFFPQSLKTKRQVPWVVLSENRNCY